MKEVLDCREAAGRAARALAVLLASEFWPVPQELYEPLCLYLDGPDLARFAGDVAALGRSSDPPGAGQGGGVSAHWRQRFLDTAPALAHSTGLLLAGFCTLNLPAGVDCGACGLPTCADLARLREGCAAERGGGPAAPGATGAGRVAGLPAPVPLCASHLLSFSAAVSRAQALAQTLHTNALLLRSAGVAAICLGVLEAEFAVGLALGGAGDGGGSGVCSWTRRILVPLTPVGPEGGESR